MKLTRPKTLQVSINIVKKKKIFVAATKRVGKQGVYNRLWCTALCVAAIRNEDK